MVTTEAPKAPPWIRHCQTSIVYMALYLWEKEISDLLFSEKPDLQTRVGHILICELFWKHCVIGV
jgi:hypothetical protein